MTGAAQTRPPAIAPRAITCRRLSLPSGARSRSPIGLRGPPMTPSASPHLTYPWHAPKPGADDTIDRFAAKPVARGQIGPRPGPHHNGPADSRPDLRGRHAAPIVVPGAG